MFCYTSRRILMPRNNHPKTTRKNASLKPQELPAKFKTGFLTALDGRTDLSKTLRANYDAIVSDIGGDSEIGHVKGALIERFVWLEGILQTIEHEMVTGQASKTEAIGRWIQAVNSLSGLAKVLGVERKASNRPWVLPVADDSAENLEDK